MKNTFLSCTERTSCINLLVFSVYGRAHIDAIIILEYLATRTARRRGLRDHRLILKRVRRSIGVAIWTRAASMVTACLPPLTSDAEALAFGARDLVDD